MIERLEKVDIIALEKFERFHSKDLFQLVYKDSLGRRCTMYLTNRIPADLITEVNRKMRKKLGFSSLIPEKGEIR